MLYIEYNYSDGESNSDGDMGICYGEVVIGVKCGYFDEGANDDVDTFQLLFDRKFSEYTYVDKETITELFSVLHPGNLWFYRFYLLKTKYVSLDEIDNNNNNNNNAEWCEVSLNEFKRFIFSNTSR